MIDDQGDLFPDLGNRQQTLDLAPASAVPEQDPSVPLDAQQQFAEADSFQVREEFEKLVRLDLLGPWGGDLEAFSHRAAGPRERYLLGMLGPKHTPKSAREEAGEVPDTETGVSGDARDAELSDKLTPQNLGRIWASSMGLSFAVPADVDAVSVTVSWGRYAKTEIELEDGKKVSTWARQPISVDKEIRLEGEPTYHVPLTGGEQGVYLAVAVRSQPNDRRVVELTLVNAQPEPESNPDTAWLFQAELRVRVLDGDAAIFLPIDDPLDGDSQWGSEDFEEKHLRLLYRNHRRYASGRNVAVHAKVRDDERVAHELVTTWIPYHDVPATIAASDGLGSVELSMDELATADLDRLKQGLSPLADGYLTWLDTQEHRDDVPEALRKTAEKAVFEARLIAQRVQKGVELLTDPSHPGHEHALRAFRFANAAMADQRRHSTAAKLRQENGWGYEQALAEVESRGPGEASWRPFQLAFVLLNLPALADPGHAERAADRTGLVDLLFFPTGGGKTEAYLGLTAFTLAIRRLQGKLGSGADTRDGSAGVAVLMRYTLRLLTAQQFQRAAALICAAEVLRRKEPAAWGAEPFRIGLWVGAGVSPNWFSEAIDQIDEARQAGDGKRTNVLQTLTCPWCGEELAGHKDLHPDTDRRRVLLYCRRGEGDDPCPFSKRGEDAMLRELFAGREGDDLKAALAVHREGLPILTIDEEIYRYAPSLVIATVDKLAQLPWKGYAGLLFGRVSRKCPRHGYRHDDLDLKTDCGDRHFKKNDLAAVPQSEPVTRLRPPDLIIQDELHLISGALGTTVGLFETAIAELCTWRLPDGQETGPKIVASTATTKRAKAQVLGVFGKDLAIFPPQVIDIGDTFFSRQVPLSRKHPGRRYLGLCAHGVRLKSAEIRLAEILLIAGQTLFDKYGAPADPYMTLVGYFNATRELAGMRRYVDDDVTTRVRRHGRLKGLSNRIASKTGMLAVQELTSRISSGDISEVLRRLEHRFDPDLDTSRRRLEIPAEWSDVLKEKDRDKRRKPHPLARKWADRNDDGSLPVDVALATSMLQVGVDVSRFGLMMVIGQPKNTAEYIQASSRVGRDSERPGLVLTLYNWSRPRDLAHFEDFEHYHATFYRQVEALSVTPFTRRALDRGATAAFVAAVRQAAEGYSRELDAHDVPLDGEIVKAITNRFLARAEAVGESRAREYLLERLKVIVDLWTLKKTGSTRLGYREGTYKKQPLVGLLDMAGDGKWGDLTVGQSMRETENEINLILPGGGQIFVPLYGAPAWSFTTSESEQDPADIPEGDELGEVSR
ncbi:DISARM system helicase DrmA [Nonomuraea angiospora]|uniref:DISARM system helicase DrmA n=1 Tax=Nonomuraea angiospora TaxID=46172 RepID=UPI0033DDF3EF